MRLRKGPFLWLLEKEARELLFSSAWWLLLLCMGPLVGISFLSATRSYAEVSGLNGTAAGVGEALDPLTGIWAPTFSACELAAVFLLPFVAIRLAAGDGQSGALKLEIQHPMPAYEQIFAKVLVLLAGWLVAMLPAFIAIVVWRRYGGSVYLPEIAALTFGHVLNAGLTISLAAAMGSIASHAATAAILTLGVTVATWIISFVAAIQGGWWERVAAWTPAAMVAEFQHGLLRLTIVLAALLLILAGIALAALWIRLGVPVRRRILESVALAAVVAAGIFATTFVRASWDLSESRGNSFSQSDERALRSIHGRLRIDVHLAPEDPRRAELERRALSKLRRVMPDVEIRYSASTSIGLFEQTGAGYGEIWYQVGGRKIVSRTTAAEGVLEAIYSAAGITPQPESDDPVFRGHPLAVYPKAAGWIFYVLWPGLVLGLALLVHAHAENRLLFMVGDKGGI